MKSILIFFAVLFAVPLLGFAGQYLREIVNALKITHEKKHAPRGREWFYNFPQKTKPQKGKGKKTT